VGRGINDHGKRGRMEESALPSNRRTKGGRGQ